MGNGAAVLNGNGAERVMYQTNTATCSKIAINVAKATAYSNSQFRVTNKIK
jgi:hypothetical protein